MGFTHLLLEIYCDCKKNNKPKYCVNGINIPGAHCFGNDCEFLSYTECPNEIAYAGHNSIVENWDDCVGFGGEMEPHSNDEQEREILISKWKEICIKKISEAHNDYMELKKDMNL